MPNLLDGRNAALIAFMDAVVPADESPSASEVGGMTFLSRVLADRPEWTARTSLALDAFVNGQ